MEKKRILLHMCCGPCALIPIQQLQTAGFEVTGFFYNPNIHPLTEYIKRRDGALEVAKRLNIKMIVKDDEYEPQKWFRSISFREKNRCFHCYADRIERTNQIARRGKFNAFTTSLLYSKFQKHAVISDLCEDFSTPKTSFYYEDFREGWKDGITLSKEWEIYRQSYCGCLYSENERYANELK